MIETTVEVKGMMCGMCEAHVCDAIRGKFNVKKVSAAIDATGYEAGSVTSHPQEKKGLFGSLKK